MKTVIYIDKDLKDRAERVAMETTGEPLSTIVEKFLQDLCVRQNKLPSVNSSRRNRHLV